MDNLNSNNKVNISGTLVSDFEYSHNVKDKKIYKAYLETERLSGIKDVIPLLTKDIVEKDCLGKRIKVDGRYRSYNLHGDDGNHLILYVSPQNIKIEEDTKDENYIFLDGFVCKQPVYRRTPFGREITDLLLAVNRTFGKSSYIPCICWGHNAKFAKEFKVGSHIQVAGRIQSREYKKKIDDRYEIKTAYEVSINSIINLKGNE